MDTFTTVAMTYNLWGIHWWAEREAALRAFFQHRAPDLLAVQELKPESLKLIDSELTGHTRVDDDFPGWSVESNIWWNRELYQLIEYGAEDIGIRNEFARLFWVRLRIRAFESGPSLLFSTAHYSYQSHPQEWADGISPRVDQARRTVEELHRLADADPCVFVGDLNDIARPLYVLREAGYQDSFSAIGRTSPSTHPAIPNANTFAEGGTESVEKAFDYQFHRGPIAVRSSEVVEYFHRGIAPSDHKPVVVTYTITRS